MFRLLYVISTSKSKSPYDFFVQESFDYGNSNINSMAASLPYGSSPAIFPPPPLGKYTSMLLQVQQSSAALSNSAELRFNGVGRINDTLDQN